MKELSIFAGLGPRGGAGREAGSRVLRGGSWNNDNPDNFRAANRNNNEPTRRNNNYGFRCGLSVRQYSSAGARLSTEGWGVHVRVQAGSWSRSMGGQILKRRGGLVARANALQAALRNEGQRVISLEHHRVSETVSAKLLSVPHFCLWRR